MSEQNMTLAQEAKMLFDGILEEHVPALSTLPDFNEDEVLALTRKIRIRQLAIDLDKNRGELSLDPDERKVQLTLLKDLDSQATKIKMIGAKEKASEADREASLAVQRMLNMLGEKPYRRDPTVEGIAVRERPSIADAPHLKALELKPDETQIGIDTTTFDELMQRTENT